MDVTRRLQSFRYRVLCIAFSQRRSENNLNRFPHLVVEFDPHYAVAHCVFANGFSMRTPEIVCPAFRSSDRMRWAPLLIAAATMRASQNPRRDSSSIPKALEISDSVVSTHQMLYVLITRRAEALEIGRGILRVTFT